MTSAEELADLELIRDALTQAVKDNASSGALLGYTSNGTKITYEGITKTYETLRKVKQDIAQLSIAITNNEYSGQ